MAKLGGFGFFQFSRSKVRKRLYDESVPDSAPAGNRLTGNPPLARPHATPTPGDTLWPNQVICPVLKGETASDLLSSSHCGDLRLCPANTLEPLLLPGTWVGERGADALAAPASGIRTGTQSWDWIQLPRKLNPSSPSLACRLLCEHSRLFTVLFPFCL